MTHEYRPAPKGLEVGESANRKLKISKTKMQMAIYNDLTKCLEFYVGI